MFYRRTALLACALIAGCARQPKAAPARTAVLRFENLTADPSLDWMGRAFADVLTREVGAIPLAGRSNSAPGISAERPLAIAAGANRFVYGQYAIVNGALRVTATVEQPGGMQVVSSVGPAGGGVLGPATAVAGQIASKVEPYPTRNEGAIRAYAQALDSGNADLYAQAVAADPNFGPAYVLWYRAIAPRDPAQGERVLEMARARGDAIAPEDRAWLDFERATLRRDPGGRLRALQELARSSPSDAGIELRIAEAATQAYDYRSAVAASRKAAELRPGDPTIWNALGYAEVYAGDLDAAVKALQEYAKLRPAEANPIDSMGDAHYYAGRFADAERYYLQAYAKDPSFGGGMDLYKAAQARLMTGDVGGADAAYTKFLEARKKAGDAATDYRAIQWRYWTGRRREALRQLEAAAPKLAGDAAALAYAGAALWRLELGDPGAAELAAKGASFAGPGSAVLVFITRFIAQPPASASEWAARADRSFPLPAQAELKDLALAYALLFGKYFAAAVPVLERLPNREGSAVLLAWAYSETGRKQDAGRLLAGFPPPAASGVGYFDTLWFPRIFQLRGDQRMFNLLSGPEKQIWDR